MKVISNFKGHAFYFNDTPQIETLVNEVFSDCYRVFAREIEIRPGDVILDVGACEGVFSIMMAKIFPQARVISLEPVQRTFFQLVRNVGLNGVTNISPYNVGVGKTSGIIPMAIGKDDWSGGSSGVMTFDPEKHVMTDVEVMTLDEIFSAYAIERCRLLKIDIEGMEYDALYASTVLPRVDYFAGEFHINTKLQNEGRDINELATWVGDKTDLIYFERCRMAE